MSNIHISLDFWDTVGKANPAFSKERGRAIADAFRIPLEDALAAYFKVKRTYDAGLLVDGLSVPSTAIFSRLAVEVGKPISDHDLDLLFQNVQYLAEVNPPSFKPETIKVMQELHAQGVTFNILSNTNYVTGKVLRKCLAAANVPIDFHLYSDEELFAKPHKAFFRQMIAFAGDREIHHFGDNQQCDVDGGRAAGVESHLTSFENLANDLSRFSERQMSVGC